MNNFQIPLINYPELEAMPLPLRPAWSMTSAACPARPPAAELPRPKAALTAATWSDTGIVPNSWDTPTDIWESSRAWMAAISACSAFPRAVAVLKFFKKGLRIVKNCPKIAPEIAPEISPNQNTQPFYRKLVHFKKKTRLFCWVLLIKSGGNLHSKNFEIITPILIILFVGNGEKIC